jgi:hypothetical protein
MYRPKVGFRVPVAKLMREQAYEATRSMLLGERFLDRRLIRRSFPRGDAAGASNQAAGTRYQAVDAGHA